MPHPQELRTEADFDAMLRASHERPVALLKHSIACGVSARGHHEFVQLDEEGDPPLYAVVVQRARELSSHIARRLGVRHETPQVLVLHAGEVVFHASHFRVTAASIRRAAHEAAGAT